MTTILSPFFSLVSVCEGYGVCYIFAALMNTLYYGDDLKNDPRKYDMKKTLLAVNCALMLLIGFDRASVAQVKPENAAAEQGKNKAKVIAVNTNEIEAFPYDAGKVKFIATSEDTNGAFAVVENTIMPGYKTTWHRHNNTDETWYILSGVLTIKINDKIAEYPAGSYILVPRGTPHGQGNFGKEPVKFILTVTPAGYERRFHDRIELYKTTKPGDPDFQKKLGEGRASADTEVLGVWDIKK